jgi:putative hydrolase of the HAD superfamily
MRAVFFDAVGTLLVPQPPAYVIYAAVADQHGLAITAGKVRERFHLAYEAEEDADRLSGWVTDEARELQRWQSIVRSTLAGVSDPNACFQMLFEHFSSPAAWRLTPHVELVLGELEKRGLILGIGSNYDSRLKRVLDGFPALDAVRSRTVISAAIGFRKPAVAFFRQLLRIAGCASKELLFVGDDFTNDYLGARSAGLDAVLIIPPSEDTPVPVRRIESLLHLLDKFGPFENR